MRRAALLLLLLSFAAHAVDKKYAGKGTTETEACEAAKQASGGQAERISDCSCRLTGTVNAKRQALWRCELVATFKNRSLVPIDD